jgi:hypothetical protein
VRRANHVARRPGDTVGFTQRRRQLLLTFRELMKRMEKEMLLPTWIMCMLRE